MGLTSAKGKERPAKESGIESFYAIQPRLARFQAMDATTLPSGKTDLRDWLNLAAEWAEVVYQANSLPPGDAQRDQIQPDLAFARRSLDDHFWAFIQARYSAVDYYQDNKGPISLAMVNRWLQQQVSPDERLALICFDGLALDQWFLLRGYLQSALPHPTLRENRTYAIAPTITPVSRQALWAGRLPTGFAETITQTDQDAARWQAYWVNQNVPAPRVSHVTVKANGQGLDEVRALAKGRNRRLGILVNLFDEVMHGIKGMSAEADKRVYYGALRGHLENGKLGNLFEVLLSHGYRVFLTADHGNVAGVGLGLTPPKALVESYARRVAIFDRVELAEEYAAKHGLRAFRTKALPLDLHPVYLPGNGLFATQGATQISHGGLSLEELIVPFVEVASS